MENSTDRKKTTIESTGKMRMKYDQETNDYMLSEKNKPANFLGKIRVKIDNTREAIHNLISEL